MLISIRSSSNLSSRSSSYPDISMVYFSSFSMLFAKLSLKPPTDSYASNSSKEEGKKLGASGLIPACTCISSMNCWFLAYAHVCHFLSSTACPLLASIASTNISSRADSMYAFIMLLMRGAMLTIVQSILPSPFMMDERLPLEGESTEEVVLSLDVLSILRL